jgi:hypothetical protein
MLRIAPSALSRQIQRMEDLAGLSLFERLPRGVNLTPAGEILFGYVQRWEKDFGALNDDLRALAGLRAGTLKLATVEIATYSVVPRAIRALRNVMPGITVNTNVGVTDGVLGDVAEGKASQMRTDCCAERKSVERRVRGFIPNGGKMAHHGRRRWTLLLRRGAMTPQPATRSNRQCPRRLPILRYARGQLSSRFRGE